MRDQTKSIISRLKNAKDVPTRRAPNTVGVTAIITVENNAITLPSGMLQSMTITPLDIADFTDTNFTIGLSVKNGIEEVKRNYVITRLSNTLTYNTQIPASLLTITLNAPLTKLALTVNMVNT